MAEKTAVCGALRRCMEKRQELTRGQATVQDANTFFKKSIFRDKQIGQKCRMDRVTEEKLSMSTCPPSSGILPVSGTLLLYGNASSKWRYLSSRALSFR